MVIVRSETPLGLKILSAGRTACLIQKDLGVQESRERAAKEPHYLYMEQRSRVEKQPVNTGVYFILFFSAALS